MSNPWEEIDKPLDDVHVRRADPRHPYDFFFGKNIYGQYLFIYQTSKDSGLPSKFPPLKGLDVSVFNTDATRLVITLKESHDWEIFLALCQDLLLATKKLKQAESVAPVIIRRLARWQEFLKREKDGLLSESEIKGLIGELLFMETRVAPVFGISDAVRFWQGPEGASQDFNIGDAAVEVKCRSGYSKPKVYISSAEQLNSELSEMYLHVVTLAKAPEESDDGIDLVTLTNRIKNQIDSEAPALIERFNDLLQQSGYVEREAYRDYRYLLTDHMMFEVVEEFPRIAADAIGSGVSDVKYSISLDSCMPYLSEPEWLRSK